MKIVCIGNSIVNGYPLKRSQCFASLWRQRTGYEIINKGENGDISPNILNRFPKDVISHNPSKVLILTGTNDYIYNICTPEETMDYLSEMIKMALSKKIEPIILTPLLTDEKMASKRWVEGTNYAYVNEQLYKLAELIINYGKEQNIAVIDTQKMFLELYDETNIEDYLIDGIHPTAIGHEAISRVLPD